MRRDPGSPGAVAQANAGDPSGSKRAAVRTKVVRVGAMTIATGVVAGALYVTMPSTALACPSPPCGSPNNSPP